MFEELREIGTQAIEELSQTKQEQELLEDRLTRMEEEKEQVSEAVYHRVREDYESRCRDLEERADPLKAEARLEYAKLQALRERLQSTLETARLDKEELELRHRLGEHDDETFRERLGECEKTIEERQGELGEADELRQRFVEAFRSEEELELPPSGAAEVGQAADDDSADDDSAGDDDDSVEVTSDQEDGEEEDEGDGTSAADPPQDDPPEEALSEDDAFVDEPPATLPNLEVASTDLDSTAPTPAEDSDDGADRDNDTTSSGKVPAIPPPPPGTEKRPSESEATVLLKGPRLVVHRDDSMEEIRLGLHAVTIGRAVKNDIRFLSTSVSRHHAQVALGEDGYLVSDLRSGNGTLVNGDPVVGQRSLRDGDMIQVGSEVLIFRDR